MHSKYLEAGYNYTHLNRCCNAFSKLKVWYEFPIIYCPEQTPLSFFFLLFSIHMSVLTLHVHCMAAPRIKAEMIFENCIVPMANKRKIINNEYWMVQDYKLFELKLKTRRFFNATHGCCSFLSLYAKCLKFVLFENSVCVCVRAQRRRRIGAKSRIINLNQF